MEPKTNKDNKLKIKEVLQNFLTALQSKDITAMMKCYASDVVVFDAKPPFQCKGAVTWKHVWEASLPFFPDKFKVEVRELVIYTDGNIGFAHYFFKLKGTDKNHPAMQTWMRATTGYKLQQGKWKIIHEHGSVPFNPATMQAQFSLDI